MAKFKVVVTDWEFDTMAPELEILSQIDADVDITHQTRDP